MDSGGGKSSQQREPPGGGGGGGQPAMGPIEGNTRRISGSANGNSEGSERSTVSSSNSGSLGDSAQQAAQAPKQGHAALAATDADLGGGEVTNCNDGRETSSPSSLTPSGSSLSLLLSAAANHREAKKTSEKIKSSSKKQSHMLTIADAPSDSIDANNNNLSSNKKPNGGSGGRSDLNRLPPEQLMDLIQKASARNAQGKAGPPQESSSNRAAVRKLPKKKRPPSQTLASAQIPNITMTESTKEQLSNGSVAQQSLLQAIQRQSRDHNAPQTGRGPLLQTALSGAQSPSKRDGASKEDQKQQNAVNAESSSSGGSTVMEVAPLAPLPPSAATAITAPSPLQPPQHMLPSQFAPNNSNNANNNTWLQQMILPNHQLASLLSQLTAASANNSSNTNSGNTNGSNNNSNPMVCLPAGNDAMEGLLQMIASAQSAPQPPPSASMGAPSSSQRNTNLSVGRSAGTVPCRARGMSPKHVFKTAHFKIPKDVKHGADLVCSFPECRDGGVKFRFCAFCWIPVAKRNFRVRHGHAKEMAAAAAAAATSSSAMASSPTGQSVHEPKVVWKKGDTADDAVCERPPKRARLLGSPKSDDENEQGPDVEAEPDTGKSSSNIRIIESLDMVWNDQKRSSRRERGYKDKKSKKVKKKSKKDKKKAKKSKRGKSSKTHHQSSPGAAQMKPSKTHTTLLMHEDSRTSTDDNNDHNVTGSSDSQNGDTKKNGSETKEQDSSAQNVQSHLGVQVDPSRMAVWARLLDARPHNDDGHNMSVWIEKVMKVSNVQEPLPPPEREPSSTSELSDSFESDAAAPSKKRNRSRHTADVGAVQMSTTDEA